MTVLAEVLIGRDRPPAWRGDATRRRAAFAGWAGWLALALSGLAAAAIAGRGGHAAARQGPGELGWLAVGLAVAAALALAPRLALLAWRIAFLGVLVTPLIPGQARADAGYYFVLAVTLAVAGIRYGPRHLWWMFALALVPVWLWTGPDWVYPAANTAWLALLAVGVNAVAYWRRDRRALAAQTEHAERQRERNAVLEERARIAREMHDVVAHHMSMIAVQAETAPYRLAAKGTDASEPVVREFTALSAAAREALTDMRRLLGVLRSDAVTPDNSKRRHAAADDAAADDDDNAGGAAAGRAPQPRLEDIPALVDAARRSGARITLAMPESFPGPVPPGPGLAAYRIVQESLSNAARHAPGAPVSVKIEQEPGIVRVIVDNGPPASPRAEGAGAGHGLAGMRERAALLGGTLDAEPAGGGGFSVRAVLPAGATS